MRVSILDLRKAMTTHGGVASNDDTDKARALSILSTHYSRLELTASC